MVALGRLNREHSASDGRFWRDLDDSGDWHYLRRSVRPTDSVGPLVRVVDLFAGCGGMSLGVMEALRVVGRRPEIALAVELSNPIRAVYDANFKTMVKDGRSDVRDRFDGSVSARLTRSELATKRDVGTTHILVGGPPCQGHSDLNNHTRRRDPKNALYLRMVRAAEVLNPDTIIIENVPGVRHAAENVVDAARGRLEKLNYHVDEMVVAVVMLGVPQLRTRHILVATQNSIPGSLHQQMAHQHVGEYRTVEWAISDIKQLRGDNWFDRPSQLSADNLKRAKHLAKNDLYDLPNRLRPECHRSKPGHRYKSMYGRLRWKEPAQTITTGFGSPGQGRYLHPSQLRALTPHEAARLQFFPDFFDFSSACFRGVLAEAIGNAVPPKLSYAVVRSIYKPLMPQGSASLAKPTSRAREVSGTKPLSSVR
jgi:DNA (cytosine-5)-methyltransferase 1